MKGTGLKLPDLRLKRSERSLALAGLLLIFTLQLVHVARLYSANWDECHHLYDGYNIWTHRDYRTNAEVPPLVKMTAAFPLLFMHIDMPPNRGQSHTFEDGRIFVFSNGGDRVLFPARMMCMLFTLLLAGLLYVVARRMFGTLAALLALLLFVFDPLVLAHGTLISTDIASACGIFGTVYAFYRYTKAPSWRWLLVTGIAAGLTLVAKYTGILIAPMLVLLAAVEAAGERSLAVLGRRLAAVAGILVCGWLIVWAFYGFRYKAAPAGLELSPPLAPYLQSMPNPHNGVELATVARFHLLPEAYIWGLANTKKTEFEYTSYFFGHVYRHGPWEYFPAAFLIKSTLPLLILLVLFPVLWLQQRDRRTREIAFLLTPVCVYFAVVTSSKFEIGARHLMPIYPFLYVLAGTAAAVAFRRGPVWAVVAGVLLAWQVETSVRVAPAYMAYGNEAWGGPSQVHRYLSDANVDWGQQLKSVKQYLDANHITNCWFVYFPDGAVDFHDYGIPCRRLPTANTLSWIKLPLEAPPVIDGTVLISDGDLEGIEFGDGSLNPYESFKSSKPVAVIQQGIDVYQGRFAIPLAAALLDVRTSTDLSKAGQPQAALALANQAVGLAPDSTITQQNLADRLSAANQWSAALVHYQIADHLARTIRPDLQDTLLPGIDAGMATAQQHLTGPK